MCTREHNDVDGILTDDSLGNKGNIFIKSFKIFKMNINFNGWIFLNFENFND